jgi:hypothetical protein
MLFLLHMYQTQELQATREVMRLREELRQRERDEDFEVRLERLASMGVDIDGTSHHYHLSQPADAEVR